LSNPSNPSNPCDFFNSKQSDILKRKVPYHAAFAKRFSEDISEKRNFRLGIFATCMCMCITRPNMLSIAQNKKLHAYIFRQKHP
jgi:hypothetical protein